MFLEICDNKNSVIPSFVNKNNAEMKIICPSYFPKVCFLKGWKRNNKNTHTK